MRGGFFKSAVSDNAKGPKTNPGEAAVDPETLLCLCHHIHHMIVSDQAFKDELEAKLRSGTGTEMLASVHRRGRSGGCCGGGIHKTDDDDPDKMKLVAEILQAEEARQKGLPNSPGPSPSQLDALVRCFSPVDVPCCGKIKFQWVESDAVGEVIELFVGQVDSKMAEFMVEVMALAEQCHASIMKKAEIEEDKRKADLVDNPPEAKKPPNEFLSKLADNDNPMVQNLSRMLNQDENTSKSFRCVPGSHQDKFQRQEVVKEALAIVLKKKIGDELTRRSKMNAKTGGMVATPKGWTLCPLTFFEPRHLTELLAEDQRHTVIENYHLVSSSLLTEVKKLDADNILRPVGSTTRVRKGWLTVESINQAHFTQLTAFMFRLGAVPFEVNMKTGYHLQIPQDYLFERTLLHPRLESEPNQLPDEVFSPRGRLECGSEPALDNGRVLTAVFCMEEPKIPSVLYLATDRSIDGDEIAIPLKKNNVVLYHSKGTVSRIEHHQDSVGVASGGVSTTVTLFLRGMLK